MNKKITMRAMFLSTVLLLLAALPWAARPGAAATAAPKPKIVESNGVKHLGPAWLTKRNGVYVMYLQGSDYDMAYQHGALLAPEIKQGEVPYISGFFRDEIAHSVIGGIPPLVRLAEGFLHGLFFDPIARHIPADFRQALRGLCEGAGLDPKTLPQVMVTADAGQVIEGKVYSSRLVYPGLAPYADMGCTSFVASGPATKDGHLIHGRNLDFPGAGHFDRFPLIAFCRPSTGQRYVFISSAGVHSAGVTAMNENGLVIDFHTAITNDVSTNGWPVLILGEMVVREAWTIDQAIAILRAHPPAAGWIMVLSSGREQKGVAVELSHHGLAVIPMKNNELAVANSYRNPAMQAHETTLNWSYAINSFHRTRRMNQLLADNFGRIDPRLGASFLGDHFDLNTNTERATGNVIAQYSNVSSVVMDSTAMNIWVGVGPAPVCNSHYVGFNFEDGFNGPGHFTDLPTLHGTWEDDPRLPAYRLFISADQKFAADDPAGAVSDLQRALAIDPPEPVYDQVAGLILLRMGRPADAAPMFQSALALPQTAHKQAIGHLWLARAYDLQNQRDQARAEYQKVLAISPLDPALKKAALDGLKHPFKKSAAPKISVDFSSGDSYSY